MRLEIEQLERSLEQCRDYVNELQKEIDAAEDRYKDACNDAEKLRDDAKWAVYWAKDWMQSRQSKLRHACEKMKKLNDKMTWLRKSEEPRIRQAISDARQRLQAAIAAARNASTMNGAECEVADVSAYEAEIEALEKELEDNHEQQRETEERIGRQQDHIESCEKDLEKAISELDRTCREQQDAIQKADEKTKEAEERITSARERHEESVRIMNELIDSVTRAWDVLMQYERYATA